MIDYRKRCVCRVTQDDLEYEIIRYGETAAENGANVWRDHAPRTYDHVSVGGRRPGRAIELEYPRNRHFFNQRIA